MAAWPTALFSVLYKVSYAVSLLLVVLVILCAVVSSAPGLTASGATKSPTLESVFRLQLLQL